MYFDNTDPCWISDAPLGRQQQWRLRIAQFGDGYQQRILDGINALDTVFSVSFYRDQAVLLSMEDYLIAQQGAAFPYTDPASLDVYSVFCDGWEIRWDVKRRRDPVTFEQLWYGTLSANFTKANGVAVGPIT